MGSTSTLSALRSIGDQLTRMKGSCTPGDRGVGHIALGGETPLHSLGRITVDVAQLLEPQGAASVGTGALPRRLVPGARAATEAGRERRDERVAARTADALKVQAVTRLLALELLSPLGEQFDENRMRLDHVARATHAQHGQVVGKIACLHQIGDRERLGALLAVDEHLAARGAGVFDKVHHVLHHALHALVRVVEMDLLVAKVPGELVRLLGAIDDVRHVQLLLEQGLVGGRHRCAQVEVVGDRTRMRLKVLPLGALYASAQRLGRPHWHAARSTALGELAIVRRRHRVTAGELPRGVRSAAGLVGARRDQLHVERAEASVDGVDARAKFGIAHKHRLHELEQQRIAVDQLPPLRRDQLVAHLRDADEEAHPIGVEEEELAGEQLVEETAQRPHVRRAAGAHLLATIVGAARLL
mmetsp:Transcript_16016/g.41107  ORF Transcript_16016/g.41107 Transcript_16016/m.41107 type:complete len:415 (-) Transcript_16016:6015-7259(-)